MERNEEGHERNRKIEVKAERLVAVIEEETPPRHPHSNGERGYFTAIPRQDRMTYFGRLLLSRGASSAVLISNRKSRGEPRQTAGQSAATALLLHRPRPRKKGSPTNPGTMFGLLLLPRHLHTPCQTIRLLSVAPRRTAPHRDTASRHCKTSAERCFANSRIYQPGDGCSFLQPENLILLQGPFVCNAV